VGFSGVSCRMGGLTFATEAGVPEHILWMQSGHSQDKSACRSVRLTNPDRLYDTWPPAFDYCSTLLDWSSTPLRPPPPASPPPPLPSPSPCSPFIPPAGPGPAANRLPPVWLAAPQARVLYLHSVPCPPCQRALEPKNGWLLFTTTVSAVDTARPDRARTSNAGSS
jgi:hypothetical protein